MANLLTLLLVPALLTTSCVDMGAFDQVKEDFHYSYPFPAGGRLDFSNRNGSAQIAGWDRNEIDVSGTKSANDRADLTQIKINVDVHGSAASVSAEFPQGGFGRSYGAQFVIRVPRRTVLGQAQTTNGSISAEDLEGGGRLSSTNGRILLARDAGDYDGYTSNATIEFEECSGNLTAVTTNGAVRGRLKSGGADVRSTNGSIDVTLLNPPNGGSVRASTTNGSVTLALAGYHANPINVESTNGSVTLRLPSDANAHLDAHTNVGTVNYDFTVNGSVSSSKHSVSGDLGSGGPPIMVHTTVGGIHIEKY
ncbi:MAG TPA: DUF4097 family beta strand repeat-containing protein [Bryobacteraceae bacterium]|jgi:hypothetical protein|nr:DUF4097 family beta strand repeat-containing protein [Bryobacteraceae bacterium]